MLQHYSYHDPATLQRDGITDSELNIIFDLQFTILWITWRFGVRVDLRCVSILHFALCGRTMYDCHIDQYKTIEYKRIRYFEKTYIIRVLILIHRCTYNVIISLLWSEVLQQGVYLYLFAQLFHIWYKSCTLCPYLKCRVC